mmetsp:Transcript_24517/g.70386  ORF Transcript_24517/g.70386 Transcript_24517/m.70386 type:complete len:269 (+) Transcript_24517:178-984(+)
MKRQALAPIRQKSCDQGDAARRLPAILRDEPCSSARPKAATHTGRQGILATRGVRDRTATSRAPARCGHVDIESAAPSLWGMWPSGEFGVCPNGHIGRRHRCISPGSCVDSAWGRVRVGSQHPVLEARGMIPRSEAMRRLRGATRGAAREVVAQFLELHVHRPLEALGALDGAHLVLLRRAGRRQAPRPGRGLGAPRVATAPSGGSAQGEAAATPSRAHAPRRLHGLRDLLQRQDGAVVLRPTARRTHLRLWSSACAMLRQSHRRLPR